jgi:DNA-directed RNA polymerase subunit RPC12/RpoP
LANRICPQCGQKVPAGRVLALSDGMECPHCHAGLQVATGSRILAIWVGLAAGWLVWRLTRDSAGVLGAVLPELYAFLAFGIITPIVLAFSAALRPVPAMPALEATPATSHGGAHH